jgi:hypothetical protein
MNEKNKVQKITLVLKNNGFVITDEEDLRILECGFRIAEYVNYS